MNRVKQTNRHRNTEIDNHSIGYEVEVGASYIEKGPQGHKVVNEISVVKLKILVGLAYAGRSFEGFAPVEQIAVFLRLDRVVEVLVKNLANNHVSRVKLNAVRSCLFILAKAY